MFEWTSRSLYTEIYRLTVRFTSILPLAAAFTIAATPAAAAELKLEFRDGRVTLVARDVSVRQILSEWSKVGRTQIVNGDRTSSTPVTLQIDGLPERQALEVVLRSVAGYVAAPRRAGNPGPSIYDRILVLAVSSPAPAAPPGGNRPLPAPVFPRQPTPREGVAPPPLLLPPEEVDEDPNPVRPNGPPPSTPAVPVYTQPFTRAPGPPPTEASPSGTSVPGMVTPVPQQPNQPGSQQNRTR
jgi:hypothetical protein